MENQITLDLGLHAVNHSAHSSRHDKLPLLAETSQIQIPSTRITLVLMTHSTIALGCISVIMKNLWNHSNLFLISVKMIAVHLPINGSVIGLRICQSTKKVQFPILTTMTIVNLTVDHWAMAKPKSLQRRRCNPNQDNIWGVTSEVPVHPRRCIVPLFSV